VDGTILYIHGRGGSAGEAARYRALCPGNRVLGLDYHGTTPWETREEILAAYDGLRRRDRDIIVAANSIGAYFAMNALQGKEISRALFVSPILDMEELICALLRRSGLSEAALAEKREIETPFGETLSWDYLCYVRAHPIVWTAPTCILRGERDDMTSRGTVQAFAERHGAEVTVLPGGEHWFHTEEQMAFHDAWVRRCLAAADDGRGTF